MFHFNEGRGDRRWTRVRGALSAAGLVACCAVTMPWPLAAQQAAPAAKPAVRLAEEKRQAIFADFSACRAETQSRVGQYDQNSTPPEASSRARSRYYRMRSKTAEDVTAACSRQMTRKYKLQDQEIDAIVSEGTCKQWTPLTGSPAC